MPTRSEILTLGRRLHNALRYAVEDSDNYHSEKVSRKDFEHYACGMYLAGTLAFLEGKYGTKPWQASGSLLNLDAFLSELGDKRALQLKNEGISESGLQALICIRNAVVHNDGNLSKNTDRDSALKVSIAAIPGVTLSDSVVQLSTSHDLDFMEYVRKSFVAVSMQHGDL